MPDVERRTFSGEVRAKEGDGMAFTGYAARFNEETWIGPPNQGFYERIAPGAFAAVLKRSDVRALFNHNPDYLLGRTSAGTLTLVEDREGLHVEASLPDTSLGRDVSALVARGDLTGQSFSFRVAEGGSSWERRADGAMSRTITEFDELVDVGPVTFPAYDTTTADVRSIARKAHADLPPDLKTAREARGGDRRTEKRGLVASVCAADAACDAAGEALAAGNLAQAMALLDAALAVLYDADWYLWNTDEELLEALGCGDASAALSAAWNAVAAAIGSGDLATEASDLDLTAALAATDELLAALRLPDADGPATDDTEGTPTDDGDDMNRNKDQSEMEAQWLEAAGVLAVQ